MLMWFAYYLYLLFQIVLMFYAIIEFSLMIRAVIAKRKQNSKTAFEPPKVTVQLPLYNEQFVVDRLIDCVCELKYPADKLEIQVLDDSDDETVQKVASKVQEYQAKGIDIVHIRRPERVGFKAGALAYGLERSKGEFVAIFDADFLPKPDFLQETIPYFQNPKTGVVQTRWSHINKNYSLLTRLQAIFLNTHFTVEQLGRSESGAYINFNGTAGVWRKECILDSGGWQADTLTEDLDLSFRAQMKGWKFDYLINQESPAELPATLPAFKVQQFRWSKGAAECSKKNLGALFRTKDVSFFGKIVGAFHLLNSSAYIVIFGFIILSLPLAFFFEKYGSSADPFGILIYTYITSALLFSVFLAGNLMVSKNKLITVLSFPILFPLFLILSMGISLYLMIGVVEGYLGKKSAFVRTPKFNLGNNAKKLGKNVYSKFKVTPILVLELILLGYCIVSIYYTVEFWNVPLLVYVAMFTTGLLANIGSSIYHNFRR